MACVFHGQSCDVKKAGAFFQQPSYFSFFSKLASFGYLISIFFIGPGCRLVESASDDFGGRSLLCWSSSGDCCHFADTGAGNASEKLG